MARRRRWSDVERKWMIEKSLEDSRFIVHRDCRCCGYTDREMDEYVEASLPEVSAVVPLRRHRDDGMMFYVADADCGERVLSRRKTTD